jgi:Uncharacterized conserved small protein
MSTYADNDNQQQSSDVLVEPTPPKKVLSEAAKRALAEAEERRRNRPIQELPPEIGGRGGADPARFGDWEINGRAIDF